MKAFSSLVLIGGLSVCASGQTQPPAFSTGQAARLVIGQTSFTSANYGATASLLGAPSGIAYANGSLWIADSNRLGALPDNNRVLRFSDAPTWPSATQDPSIIGSDCGVCRGLASLVLGQPDFISSNSSLTSTGLRNPTGIATDGKILAVADTDNNRVLIWLSMPRSNGQPADVVVGQADFTHNATAVPPTQTSLRGPIGVWIAGGRLFVADTQDNRILIYNKIPTSNNAAADVVVGQPNFTSFVQPDLTQPSATTAANNMQDPVSVSTDPSGTHMFVADLGQSRVLIFNSIPTTNGASADVVVGQPDMVSSIDNNSFTITNATLDSDNNPEGEQGVLCQSNAAFALNQNQTGTSAVDSVGTTIFPARCAATLSFPRFVISDGTRLFIADGGNDRVLVFNSIPTANGTPADSILGEPDEFTDNTGQNPDGSDAFQTPDALAWDGINLYVSDTYNNRVVVYTPAPLNIPLAAARNAASLQIYALASVGISGTIAAKDVVTIGINTTCTAAATTAGCYSYTVQSSDTLTTITDALVKAINSKPDPNVIATADDTTDSVVVTARLPGQIGSTVTLMAITSANAQISAIASNATLNLYLESPTSIAPGTLVEINGASLCDNTASADTTKPYLPVTLGGCEIFVDGERAPLLYVSPGQVNIQMPWEFVDRIDSVSGQGSISLYSRVTHADGSITASAPIGVTIVNANPGIFAGSGNDPRPGLVYHAYGNAIDAFSIDGSATAGDKVTITIGTAPNATTTNSYSYTVQTNDTLTSVQTGLVNAINSAPDPNVVAIPANEFNRVIIQARVPGPAGENISVAQSVSTNATESITIFNTATCCDNIAGSLVSSANPALPGEIVYVFATGLGPTTPNDQNSGQVFTGGSQNPALTPVDSILAGGTAANILSAFLVPGLVGVYEVEFQLSNGQATDAATQLTIAQQAHVSNVVVFPVGPTPSTTTSSIRRPTTQLKKAGSASVRR